MIKFLLDANLSPSTADYLRKLGFNTKSIVEEKLGKLTDEEIVRIAVNEKRVIISFDVDFGEIYNSKEYDKPGMVILRLKNQTVESIDDVLEKFLFKYGKKLKDNPSNLIVIKENSVRFIK